MKSFLKKIVVSILTLEAQRTLGRFRPKIVAVTGSVGKTSTKDAIYEVLRGKFKCRQSEKSFNSEIGVPLTVLGLENAWWNPFKWFGNIAKGFWTAFFSSEYPEMLVLEIGADRIGDISRITSWVIPDVVVVTKLADVPVHVENFGSPDLVYKEKARLVEALPPSGLAILNADDKRVLDMKGKTEAKTITFGIRSLADCIGSLPTIVYGEGEPAGISFLVDFNKNSVPVQILGSLGESHVYPCLAAVICASEFGVEKGQVYKALQNMQTAKGRMKLIHGIKDTLIIDDTYNSSPIAAESALRALKLVETRGRKIAALADMLELGEFSAEEHRRIGSLAASSADILVTVGERAKWMAEGALANAMDESKIFQFENSVEAGIYTQTILQEGDVVLAKGSQGMRMERFVEEIMAEPERRAQLLVRQDKEWVGRK